MNSNLHMGAVKPIITIRSETEISKAIRQCAEKCMLDENIMECIQDFGDQLLKDGWDSQDIKQVQLGTLYVVSYIKQDDSLLPKREA